MGSVNGYGDLVAVSDIATRLGCDPTRVSMWLKRYDDIPAPVAILGGRRVYSWAEFSAFARRHGWLKFEPDCIYDGNGMDVTDNYVRRSTA